MSLQAPVDRAHAHGAASRSSSTKARPGRVITLLTLVLSLVFAGLLSAATPAAAAASLTWTSQTSAADNNWYSATYGNGLFVAVAISGTGNRVMTSPDGVTWTSRSSAADNTWYGVTFAKDSSNPNATVQNGLFVAVASSGTGNRAMTSTDGINWTSRTTPIPGAGFEPGWTSVTYGNGLFVAVAQIGTGNRVMTSPDGVTWTSRTTPVPGAGTEPAWRSVTYANGLFVAVATSGTGNRVMTSTDGINWTLGTSPADNQWYSVTYGNGVYVAVAASGTNRVMTSSDGFSWTTRSTPVANTFPAVTFGGGQFAAVSVDGIGNRVMTSPDGINWTMGASAVDNQWFAITYGDSRFVAVAASGTANRVMLGTAPVASTYSLTLNDPAIGGTSSATVTSGITSGGSSVLTATPATGYTFTSWSCTGGSMSGSTDNPMTLSNITGDVTCTPTFTANPTYSLTLNDPATGGTSSATVTLGISSGGSSVLTATPATGYTFTSWSCTGGSMSGSTNNPMTLSNITGDVTCTPTFTAIVVFPTSIITHTDQTVKSVFIDGTATPLTNAYYSVQTSRCKTTINGVNPGVIYYWTNFTSSGTGSQALVSETSSAGSSYLLQFTSSGSNIYKAGTTTVAKGWKLTWNSSTGALTVSGLAAGNYWIGVKYSASALSGKAAPNPTSLTYRFSGNGGGTAQSMTLSKKS